MSDINTTTSAHESPADELPLFPAQAPEALADPVVTRDLMGAVLAELAAVVSLPEGTESDPTPCRGFDLAALQRHALGWLQFFAAALTDPEGRSGRPDADGWTLAPDQDPVAVVTKARADIEGAIDDGVMDRIVVMAQARMAGGAVVAMALGEYLVHAWDLAIATGRPYVAPAGAAAPALAFLHATVAPEYRGPDSGFFDAEVPAPDDADDLTRLLCFTGRQPDWRPTTVPS